MFSGLSQVNSTSSRQFSHDITFGLNIGLFTGMGFFLKKKCDGKRSATHLGKYGPVYTLVVGSMCVLVDLVRHLLNDAWGQHCDSVDDLAATLPAKVMDTLTEALKEVSAAGMPKFGYNQVCYPTKFASMYDKNEHLTPLGFTTSIVFTYTGFVLIFIAVFWGIDFWRKLRSRWAAIRQARSSAAQRREAPLLSPAV